MGLEIERDATARACVVRLDGDVDVSIVPELRGALEQVVDTGCDHVILDLERVTYVDSTALGLIVWLDHRLSPGEGHLVLAGASSDVSRILELSGLIGVAPSVSARDSVEEAIAGLEHASSESDVIRWSESMMLPAQIDALADVRAAVCDLLSTLDLSEAALFDVKVAVGEALANAVRHGSPGGESDAVRVDVNAFEDRVEIRVRDRGVGFDPDADADGDRDGGLFASGGRGVLFMRALMDRVTFEPDADGGTIVTLVKRLRVTRVKD